MLELKKVIYSELNARQKENYNFQKVAAILADYGYNCIKLSDDWQGADFIACHINGNDFMKVQLKSKLTIDKKYIDKDIYIAFREKNITYIYNHDELMNFLLSMQRNIIANTESWQKSTEKGAYHFPNIPRYLESKMQDYII